MDKETQYIAFLRGINVGGYRSIKMAELRQMCVQMGLQEVCTYIQSGNVVFSAPGNDPPELARELKNQIKKYFDYEVPVMLRTVPQLEETLRQFPFEKREGWKRYISFLLDPPSKEQGESFEEKSAKSEIFLVRNREVFIYVDKRTKQNLRFSNSFIERHFGMPATSRNLRTLHNILDLAAGT